jgi:N-succinyldiaminopimelate aminotransferase
VPVLQVGGEVAEARGVAGHHDEVVVTGGQPLGEGTAEAGAGTGHEGGRHGATLARGLPFGRVSPGEHAPAARTAGLGETIFAEMSALAAATGSINLGQGFPDTDGPPALLSEAIEAIRAGHNQYPPGIGVPALRHAIAEHQHRHYGLTLDPDREVLVTTGATEGITAALLALIDPGDEVVALEPFYDSYQAGVQLAGGRLHGVALDPPDFRLDVDALAAAIGPRTTMLLVNSPHNPTGTVLDEDELAAVAELCVRHDLLVLTDEVYEHLTFDGARHVPLSTLPGMADRTLSAGSAGKTFSVTGWKVGWLTGPTHLVRAARSVKQYLSYASGAPLQPAVAHALRTQDAWVADLRASLQRRRDLLVTGLRDLGLDTYRPAGTYFAVSDVRSWGYDDGIIFCRELPTRAGVVAIPCAAFYGSPDAEPGRSLIRWTFSKKEAVLTEALDRLGSRRAAGSV